MRSRARAHRPCGGRGLRGINCGNPHSTAGIYIVDEGGRTSNAVCVTW